MMDSDSDDGTIILESAPSSPTSPPMLTGLHLYRYKHKQLMEIHAQRNKGYNGESSSDESEPSQSILKPKSPKMYRSPVFSPTPSKIVTNIKAFDDSNDRGTVNNQSNETDCDSDCTEVEEESQILQEMSEASQRNNDEICVLESGNSQLNVETSEITGLDTSVSKEPQLCSDNPEITGLDKSVLKESQLEENTPEIRGLDKLVSKELQIEEDTLEITGLDMPISNTGNLQSEILKVVEQEVDGDRAVVSRDRELSTTVTEDETLRKVKASEDILHTDDNSETTQNDISWEVDKEHRELMELETKLKMLKDGEETGINCKLLSIKMQLKLLNESFKNKRAKIIDKLVKLHRESSKNRQRQELENINSKQKILLKLVKIYRSLSYGTSNPLTSDGKRSVQRMSQSERVNQLRSVKNTEREKQGLSKRKSTDVDLNLVVKKLISSGLVKSSESSELSREKKRNNQEVFKNAGHFSSRIASGNPPQLMNSTAYDSALNPVQKNISMSNEKGTAERIYEMSSTVEGGSRVINQYLNQVPTNPSAQNEHVYHKPSEGQFMLANMKMANNEIRQVVLLNPANLTGNNIYTATPVFHHQPVAIGPMEPPVMLIEAPRCVSVCNTTSTQKSTTGTSKNTKLLQQPKRSKIIVSSTEVPISTKSIFVNTPSSLSTPLAYGTTVPSSGVMPKNKSAVSLTSKSKRGNHGNKKTLPGSSKNTSASSSALPQSISQIPDIPTTSSPPVPYIDLSLNQTCVTEIPNGQDAASENQMLLKSTTTCKPSMSTVTSQAVASISCHSTFDTSCTVPRSPTLVTSETLSGSVTPGIQTQDDAELQKRLKNCRIFLIDNNELFPSKQYLPDMFWTNKFGNIDLPTSLMNDIDNWN